MQWLKRISLVALAALMFAPGVLHFANTAFFLRIMPPYLPWHRELVYLSGAIEIVLAAGLLWPRARRAAAWGVIALLIAVFPANIHGFLHQEIVPAPGWLHLLRLPLQGVLIAWAYWHTRPDARPTAAAANKDA